MSEISSAPDIRVPEIPIDTWTKPFWDATAKGSLQLPRCTNCHRFRWLPSPFCPHCQSQAVEWQVSGDSKIYSCTSIRRSEGDQVLIHVPALIEFPEADG